MANELQLKKLHEAATAGDWTVRTMRSDCFVQGNEVVGETIAGKYKRDILSDEEYPKKINDAEIICYLRNNAQNFAALIDAARVRLETDNAEAKAKLSLEIAESNYSDSKRESASYTKALLLSVKSCDALRLALAPFAE